MDLQQLLSAPPKLHGPDESPTDGWRLDNEGLRFLDSHLEHGMHTIETGAGVSTIVFALKKARHTCIVPDRRVVERIAQLCASARLSLATVTFVIERSEYALPRVDRSAYDLALIDGRHGFPAPFIDWFHIADRLRDGGIVLVDDTWIWTCEVLARFLDADPRWQRLASLPRLRSGRQVATHNTPNGSINHSYTVKARRHGFMGQRPNQTIPRSHSRDPSNAILTRSVQGCSASAAGNRMVGPPSSWSSRPGDPHWRALSG